MYKKGSKNHNQFRDGGFDIAFDSMPRLWEDYYCKRKVSHDASSVYRRSRSWYFVQFRGVQPEVTVSKGLLWHVPGKFESMITFLSILELNMSQEVGFKPFYSQKCPYMYILRNHWGLNECWFEVLHIGRTLDWGLKTTTTSSIIAFQSKSEQKLGNNQSEP